MKFQSVSNYVINYMCIEETFNMLVTNVFCKGSVSTAQVVANTRVESSYSLCKQEYCTSICNSQITSMKS